MNIILAIIGGAGTGCIVAAVLIVISQPTDSREGGYPHYLSKHEPKENEQ